MEERIAEIIQSEKQRLENAVLMLPIWAQEHRWWD